MFVRKPECVFITTSGLSGNHPEGTRAGHTTEFEGSDSPMDCGKCSKFIINAPKEATFTSFSLVESYHMTQC